MSATKVAMRPPFQDPGAHATLVDVWLAIAVLADVVVLLGLVLVAVNVVAANTALATAVTALVSVILLALMPDRWAVVIRPHVVALVLEDVLTNRQLYMSLVGLAVVAVV